MPPLDDVVPGAEPATPKAVTIDDIYFDTAQLRLLRWGCTLRHRTGEGWTLKLPVERRGATLTRDEINRPGSASRIPAELVAVVASLTRGAPLRAVARSHTERTVRRWRTPEGAMLVECVDDDVSTKPSRGPAVRFRQVEVELGLDTDAGLLEDFDRRLTSAGARPDPAGIKLGRALGPAAAARPDVVVPRLGHDPSAAEVIGAAVARSVRQLIVELPAVHLDLDIEGVHQARVATRRLRSDLTTFRAFIDPAWTTTVGPGLRILARELGQVRDADVMALRLRSMIALQPNVDAGAGRRIVGVLEAQRATALTVLVDHLTHHSTATLLDQLVAAAAAPPTGSSAADRAAADLSGLVAKRWRRLERMVQTLGPEPPAEALHEVRILAKRARYATEAVAPAIGPKARAFAKALAGIQEVLGELHDAATAERWLAGIVADLDPAAAFAAGRLAEAAHAESIRHRHGWEAAYATAARKRARSWLK